MEDPAVARFREYLRINTVSLPYHCASSGPKPDYESAVKFLAGQAEEIGLKMQCIQITPDHPVVVLSWHGTDPSLPSIMLNSHMDVVPVDHTQWDTPPFAAHKKPNGDIVGRGSQDMKCVGVWYLEAVRKLKGAGTKLLRTLHLTYVPDEEVGGKYGMEKFVRRQEFQALNVGFCMDEGLANPEDAFTVFHGERAVWWFNVTCSGNPGHGSRFVEDTAVERSLKLMSLIFKFREQQKKKLDSDPKLKLGDVTSVNVNVISGGVQHNVIPAEVTIGVDLRISPYDKLEDLEALVADWIKSVGGGCKLEDVYKIAPCGVTSVDPSDPWWSAFSAACSDKALETAIFSAGTDSRFLRRLNIPALGFSAIRNTPILLHNHNEFLNETIFLEGIDIYKDIIQNVANVRI